MVLKVLGDEYPQQVRFGQLKRRMPGVSSKMLAQTLHSLERDSLLLRRVEATSPPKVYYGLSDLGFSLTGPITVLRDWAETYIARIDDAGAEWDQHK